MRKKVVILGGGVGGMSAAHELIERGFDVEVFERQSLPGGKARSIPVYESLDDRGGKAIHGRGVEKYVGSRGYELRPGAKRPWLPGEHGFRFFPSFYKHVTDTMARIPFQNGTVADNLLDTSEVLFAQFDNPGIVVPARFPRTGAGFKHALEGFYTLLSGSVGIPLSELEHFISKWWQILTSCEERRLGEYEKISWWDFVGASSRSPQYAKFLARGITRSLVAAQAHLASARTIGDINIQLLLGILNPTTQTADRLLNGPTNAVWIGPWLEYLQSRGVKYCFDATVQAINCTGGLIRSATIEKDGKSFEASGDYYVAGLPIERLAPLITKAMVAADPKLANLVPLSKNVEWMNGIQYHLTRDVPIVHGHAIFVDSPWALTTVSQGQFWPDFDLHDFGDGAVRGVLSVDISDWTGKGLNGKAARDCTREEIADEVWQQLKRSLNHDSQTALRDDDLHYWFLDPDIQRDPSARRMTDMEPLLVNQVDTWKLRPDATTAIPNLFLASDYVRTHTDLATMEGANEAARSAVNGILAASGDTGDRCEIWKQQEPEMFRPLREYDRLRWSSGLAWDDRLTGGVLAILDVIQRAGGAATDGAGILPGPRQGGSPEGAVEALGGFATKVLSETGDAGGWNSQVSSVASDPAGRSSFVAEPGATAPRKRPKIRIVQKR
jgi:uncharacterized protein with NAD-binding domain and iron-sulfur cluster